MNRRNFLRTTASLGALCATGIPLKSATGKGYRAAIIGATGKGDYGHGLDLIFQKRPDIELVAVADGNAEGLQKAIERTKAKKGYADYREMLEKEKPDLVSIAPRWTLDHHPLAAAALEAGAHIYIEKPFTYSLAEADDLLARSRAKDLKIAVAHQIRLAPAMLQLQEEMTRGKIGDLLQINANGKQDQRAGGEDMIVLGTHLFDLMRFFAGDPRWCSAKIFQGKREATIQDARPATEGIGPVLGDGIEAEFAFPSEVHGRFTSRRNFRDTSGPWGLELRGTKGNLRIFADVTPKVFFQAGAGSATAPASGWTPLSPARTAVEGFAEANARVVTDWLSAIQQNREPICSGYAGMKALEMAMAVFQAGLTAGRVNFPLRDRKHPLDSGVTKPSPGTGKG